MPRIPPPLWPRNLQDLVDSCLDQSGVIAQSDTVESLKRMLFAAWEQAPPCPESPAMLRRYALQTLQNPGDHLSLGNGGNDPERPALPERTDGHAMNKYQAYQNLIAKRKKHQFQDGLTNPAEMPYDVNHVDPWEQWQANLDARIMLIGQELCDRETYISGGLGLRSRPKPLQIEDWKRIKLALGLTGLPEVLHEEPPMLRLSKAAARQAGEYQTTLYKLSHATALSASLDGLPNGSGDETPCAHLQRRH